MSLPDNAKINVFSFRLLLLCVVAAVTIYVGTVLTLNLHTKIIQEEKGQKAIQMLDSMRRPFLKIKEVEIKLIRTGDIRAASKELTGASESAESVLDHYLQQSKYNQEVYKEVKRLKEVYETWINVEYQLFNHFAEKATHSDEMALDENDIKIMNNASSAFLNTMNILGDGEVPIHHDIDLGRDASHKLIAFSGLFFLYVIGLLFYHQYTKSRTLQQSQNKLQEAAEARSQIEKDLKILNETLEKRVAARTVELEIVNEELKCEVYERKLVTEVLKESEEVFRKVSTSAQDAIIMLDNDGKISYWNEAAERIFGYLKEEAEGKNIHNLIIPEKFRKKHLKGFDRFKATGTGNMIGKTVELLASRKDGGEFPIELSLSAVKIKDRWNAIGMIRDITDRKKGEDQLLKLFQAVDQSSCIIVITDTSGIIEYVNPKFTQVTGYTFDEVIGKNPSVLKSGKTSAEIYKTMWKTITSGKEWRGELYNRKKNGELYWAYISIKSVKNKIGAITNFIAIQEDITRRKQVEEELRQSHKMASIGRLAEGVFHEILNPVNIISAHTQLLLMGVEKGSNVEKDLISIQEEIDRIEKITNKLLKFSMKKDTKVEEVEVNDLLENTLSLIKPELNLKSIKFIITLEKGLPNVMVHISELKHVFLNLITNSIEAMPEGGTLTVKTRRVRLPAKAGSEKTGVKSSEFASPPRRAGELKGDFVEISFSDTGCGIAEENIDKVFEPFFSTKKEVVEVGLGLSTSYAIIERYGGNISVESEEGKRTTFIIDLPC